MDKNSVAVLILAAALVIGFGLNYNNGYKNSLSGDVIAVEPRVQPTMFVPTTQPITCYNDRETRQSDKSTEWRVVWYTYSGDLARGGKVGEQTFPATFFWDWGLNAPYGSYNDYIGFEATAEINVPIGGIVHFEIGSDDGSALYVDNNLAINNWYDHGYYDAGQPKKADITLSKGRHKLTLNYYDKKRHAAVSFKTDKDVTQWKEQEGRILRRCSDGSSTIIQDWTKLYTTDVGQSVGDVASQITDVDKGLGG